MNKFSKQEVAEFHISTFFRELESYTRGLAMDKVNGNIRDVIKNVFIKSLIKHYLFLFPVFLFIIAVIIIYTQNNSTDVL